MKKAGSLNKYYSTALRAYRVKGEILSPAQYRVVNDIINLTGRPEKVYKELRHALGKVACSEQIWPILENYPAEIKVKARLRGIIIHAIPD